VVLPWVDWGEYAEPRLELRCGVEAEILAIGRADQLYRLRKTVLDADRKGHGWQSERDDGDRHPEALDDLGNLGGRGALASGKWNIGEDRGDDQRVRLLNSPQARSSDCLVM
jgi:hypothetical protein